PKTASKSCIRRILLSARYVSRHISDTRSDIRFTAFVKPKGVVEGCDLDDQVFRRTHKTNVIARYSLVTRRASPTAAARLKRQMMLNGISSICKGPTVRLR